MKILDACCGSKMFHFDKSNPDITFMDKRTESHTLCDGRHLEIKPDIEADFTDMPFDNESFHVVVFDPPHFINLGKTSWMAKKYGVLTPDWKTVISDGFRECFRVLKPNGVLIFKWNESQIKVKEILSCTTEKPLVGHVTGRQMNTHWITFIKNNKP